MRRGMRQLLELEDDLVVIGEANTRTRPADGRSACSPSWYCWTTTARHPGSHAAAGKILSTAPGALAHGRQGGHRRAGFRSVQVGLNLIDQRRGTRPVRRRPAPRWADLPHAPASATRVPCRGRSDQRHHQLASLTSCDAGPRRRPCFAAWPTPRDAACAAGPAVLLGPAGHLHGHSRHDAESEVEEDGAPPPAVPALTAAELARSDDYEAQLLRYISKMRGSKVCMFEKYARIFSRKIHYLICYS